LPGVGGLFSQRLERGASIRTENNALLESPHWGTFIERHCIANHSVG